MSDCRESCRVCPALAKNKIICRWTSPSPSELAEAGFFFIGRHLNQCCGSIYIVFGSGSCKLFQLGSGSRCKPFNTVTFLIWKHFLTLFQNNLLFKIMAHEGSSDLQYYDEFLTVSPAFILITLYIYPDSYLECGSGSTKLLNTESNLNPDSQHWFEHKRCIYFKICTNVHTFVFTPGSLQNFFFNIFVVVYTVQGRETTCNAFPARLAKTTGNRLRWAFLSNTKSQFGLKFSYVKYWWSLLFGENVNKLS